MSVIIVEPSYEIIIPKTPEEGMDMLRLIERAARNCYKSENKISENGTSALSLVTTLRDSGHHAMLEFGNMTVKFVIDRGLSHELVRHRLASYAQTSTRWVDYKEGIQVIKPSGIFSNTPEYDWWLNSIEAAQVSYTALIKLGCKPQIARSVLPLCLKTEIIMSANLREWVFVLQTRTGPTVHPDMRDIMVKLLQEVKTLIPVVFDDIKVT